jgi:hypothetical protein
LLSIVAFAVCEASDASAAGFSWYRFETLASATTPDDAGRLPAATEGVVELAPGRVGRGLKLDGRGYASVPGSEKQTFPDGLTLEAWVRPDLLNAGRLIDRATPGTADSVCLDTHPGNAVRFITPACTITAADALEAGRWTHVVAVYDPEAGFAGIYVDGRLAAQQAGVARAEIGGPNRWHLGAARDGQIRFTGMLDEVRIYDYPLPDADVAARVAGREVGPSPASTAATRPVFYGPQGPDVDVAALLARNDIVYLSPAVNEHEALPVGNGRLNAVVWNERGIDLQINHANNVWFQHASGRVRIDGLPDPAANPAAFEERLSLHDGRVRLQAAGAAGEWRAEVGVLPQGDVIAIHVEGRLPAEPLRVHLEQWRPTVRVADFAGGVAFEEDLPVKDRPGFSRRLALAVRADCRVSVVPPTARGTDTSLTLQLTPAVDATGSGQFTVYVANPVTGADVDPLAAARIQLDAALSRGWIAASRDAADRWHRFWERSFVHLSSPDGAADYMENLWFLHLYWMGCAGEGELAVKFNGGPFLMHEDHRSWGGHYWFQNTRELYWPLPAANHLELCAPFQRLYLSTAPAHRRLAETLYGKRGMQVEETMSIAGTGDKAGNAYTMLYLSTGIECALQLHRQCVYTRDDAMLREQVYPMLKETVEFFMDYATLGADGRHHVVPENARETYWRVQDGMTTNAALRVALPLLVQESTRLGLDADRRPAWTSFLATLAPLPIDDAGTQYMPCVIPPQMPPSDNPTVQRLYVAGSTVTDAMTRKFNSENVETDVVYPFGLAGIGTDNRALAERAFRTRPFQGSYGWDWAAIVAARLGLGDEAARLIAGHCRSSQHWPQGFWDSPSSPYWANGLVDCPYFDSSGVNATATTEMLLQSHDGRIRVWPAVPKTWCGGFRLRSETGFMVVSERSGGATHYIELESLIGDECRVVNPWAETAVVTAGDETVVTSDAPELRFATRKGGRYRVERAAAPLKTLAFTPLRPEPNRGVKVMAAASRRGGKAATPTPGQPSLGITRDGLTAPRLAAAQNRQAAAERLGAVLAGKARQSHIQGSMMGDAGTVTPATWLCDGVFGAAQPRTFAATYRIDLESAAPVSAVVWSYDRKGERLDFSRGPPPAKILLAVSVDGQTWQPAGEAAYRSPHGDAVPCSVPTPCRFLRLSFRTAEGQPANMPCDEIEVY